MSLGPALNKVYGRVIKRLSLAPLLSLIAYGLLTDTCALRHRFQVEFILDTEIVKLSWLKSHLLSVILWHFFINLIEDLNHLLHIDIICLTVLSVIHLGALSFISKYIKRNLGTCLDLFLVVTVIATLLGKDILHFVFLDFFECFLSTDRLFGSFFIFRRIGR